MSFYAYFYYRNIKELRALTMIFPLNSVDQ